MGEAYQIGKDVGRLETWVRVAERDMEEMRKRIARLEAILAQPPKQEAKGDDS